MTENTDPTDFTVPSGRITEFCDKGKDRSTTIKALSKTRRTRELRKTDPTDFIVPAGRITKFCDKGKDRRYLGDFSNL